MSHCNMPTQAQKGGRDIAVPTINLIAKWG